MTTYRHPKLERTAKNYGTTFILEDNKGEIMRKNMYEKELLALGFEEVVEEKEIPKAKKLTVKEITDYYGKIQEGLDEWVVKHNKENKIDVLITSAIVGFLRDHDLLEE